MSKPDLVGVLVNTSGTLFRDTGRSSNQDPITLSGVGGGGATTFLELTDTPDDYSLFPDDYVKVNRDGDALEFGELTTGVLTDWAPFSEQILFFSGDNQRVESIPDRSLAAQFPENITSSHTSTTIVDPDSGKCVKLITSDGSGNALQVVELEDVGGGKPGTRNYVEFTSKANVSDTISLTGSFAIITLASGTGSRSVVGIDNFTLTSQGAWVLLEWRELMWSLIDHSASGVTINLT